MLFISNDGGAVFSILPELSNKSVVIIDTTRSNAEEYQARDTTAWWVVQIRDWFISKGKPFDPKDKKPILLGKSREMFVQKNMFLKN